MRAQQLLEPQRDLWSPNRPRTDDKRPDMPSWLLLLGARGTLASLTYRTLPPFTARDPWQYTSSECTDDNGCDRGFDYLPLIDPVLDSRVPRLPSPAAPRPFCPADCAFPHPHCCISNHTSCLDEMWRTGADGVMLFGAGVENLSGASKAMSRLSVHRGAQESSTCKHSPCAWLKLLI
jgi:hypothetical protein